MDLPRRQSISETRIQRQAQTSLPVHRKKDAAELRVRRRRTTGNRFAYRFFTAGRSVQTPS